MMNYHLKAILAMAFSLFIMLGLFAKELGDKEVIFYYQGDGSKIEDVIAKFTSPSFQSKENASASLAFIKANNPSLPDILIGQKTYRIKAKLSHIDLYKLKSYYLQIEGGKGYTEELYQEERHRQVFAESFSNKRIFAVSYNYLPLYRSNSENQEQAQFNSLLGGKLSFEYQLNQFQTPLFATISLAYRRWSNIQSLSETTPVEKRATVSPPATWEWEVGAGFNHRLSPWRFSATLANRTNYIPRFIAQDDRSYILSDQRIIFYAVSEYFFQENKDLSGSLEAKLGHSIYSNGETINSNSGNYHTELENSYLLSLSFSPKLFWKKRNFIQYQLIFDQWTGKESILLHSHQISIGRFF